MLQDDIVCEEIFVLSDVGDRHDNGFMKKVEDIIDAHLKARDSVPVMKHQFTDGCACQYKSRYTSHDLSYYTVKVHRNYFKTAHAKGPQDAAGGLIKRMADMAVIRGQAVIQNAQDLYDFCVKNLTQPRPGSKVYRRYFHVVTADDIYPKGCSVPVGPLKGIRSLHRISSCDQPGTVMTRSLSCYSCDNCIEGNYSNCQNEEICGPVKKVKLEVTSDKTQEIQEEEEGEEEEEEEGEELSHVDAVKEKDVVQVCRHVDNSTVSELLKVTKAQYQLTRECFDDRGDGYPKGSMILRGQVLKENGIVGPNHVFKTTSTKVIFLGSNIISPVEVILEGRKILISNDEYLRLGIS